MKATGIVRRIDDLGRVVIPKEIRRIMRLRDGDPIEIFANGDGSISMKKYQAIGNMADFAKEYAESLFESTGHYVLITDMDNVVAVGGLKRPYLPDEIGPTIRDAMESRRSTLKFNGDQVFYAVEFTAGNKEQVAAYVMTPIIVDGGSVGCIVIFSREHATGLGTMELKMAETAASFLAKQLEH
ncbi:AbrB family transcriptional regulator, stage V sporulation protein T [Paenibacillus sp. UNC496MF]|uniref:stage V sporulation T C-terminal domain-containing protein n=1 Tax=Paenibacillus sp. UNC496MF TaxID=1502753 RepID=UPI0008E83BE1|nr:stage V sporulation T C-terminal domain-containing protein [Paenibacillus sp. UNC496MF]SFJ64514.1 AbrB family transcriptional regulator, stage V sporulation protein T [Paenibacillus sp. UNC496MF]